MEASISQDIDFEAAWDKAMAPIAELPVSIIEFAEGKEFCGIQLYPHQRIILKLYNREELDRWEYAVFEEWIDCIQFFENVHHDFDGVLDFLCIDDCHYFISISALWPLYL